MPLPAIILSIFCYPSLLVGNVLLLWVREQTHRAGIWPSEKFLGFDRPRRSGYIHVIRNLRRRIDETADAAEVRQFRRWLRAMYLGLGLCLFALAIFLAFLPWSFYQIPKG